MGGGLRKRAALSFFAFKDEGMGIVSREDAKNFCRQASSGSLSRNFSESNLDKAAALQTIFAPSCLRVK